MKILFTGASSFTGLWFAGELAEAGHDVHAVFTRPGVAAYEGIRQARVRRVLERCDATFACQFGDDRFQELVCRGDWDLLCHHAADVTNYKSDEFDVCRATTLNTHNAPTVLGRLSAVGQTALLATGSVFEGGEGAGSEGLPHFSPYGLSKSLSCQVLQYYCQTLGMRFGKFVISNPFGPWEDERFTAYLIRCWRSGDTPQVRTPDYVRDNIHVSLLAKAYVRFAERLATCSQGGESLRVNPSGYVESQGAFAQRFAAEMRPRLGLPCQLEFARQTAFAEPRIRINTEPLDAVVLGWDEASAWDELGLYYTSASAGAGSLQ